MSTNKNPNQTNLYLDLAIFAGFLVAATPALTGMPIHEWLGLAFGGTLIVHVLLHWKWVVTVTRRFFQNAPGASRRNYLLNLALFIAFDLIIFSGLMMSKTVLPLLGLESSRDFFWRSLHSLATNLTLLLIGLHVAVHLKWIVTTFGRYVISPVMRRFYRSAAQPETVLVEHNDRGALR
jgi:cytochrome b